MADGWDTYPHDWDERRRAVYQRDEYQCQNCGRRGGAAGNAELHCHHIVPKSKGGSHDTSNLVTLCRDCHNQVHDHHIPKMSNVSSGSRGQNAGLDDWQSSTQASEGLQEVANEYYSSETPTDGNSGATTNENTSDKTISEKQVSDTINNRNIVLFWIICFAYLGSTAVILTSGGRGLAEAYNLWIVTGLLIYAVARRFFSDPI